VLKRRCPLEDLVLVELLVLGVSGVSFTEMELCCDFLPQTPDRNCRITESLRMEKPMEII